MLWQYCVQFVMPIKRIWIELNWQKTKRNRHRQGQKERDRWRKTDRAREMDKKRHTHTRAQKDTHTETDSHRDGQRERGDVTVASEEVTVNRSVISQPVVAGWQGGHHSCPACLGWTQASIRRRQGRWSMEYRSGAERIKRATDHIAFIRFQLLQQQ